MNDIEKKKQSANTLQRHSNFGCNPLFGQIETPQTFVEREGNFVLQLAESSTKKSALFIEKKDAAKYSDDFGKSITTAIDSCKGTVLPKLYDLLLDKLYQTHFKESEIVFKAYELCDLTGNLRDNKTRVKKRWIAAAELLMSFTFQTVYKNEPKKFKLIYMINDKIRGGFSICIGEKVLPMLEMMPKAEHDTALYRVKDDNECAYHIGRKIEEVAERQNKLKKVIVSMKTLMTACDFTPEYLNASENYSRRVKWLENILNEFVRVEFLDSWHWTSGRPTALNEESMTIECVFTNERHDFTQEIVIKQSPKKTRAKKAIKADE